MIGARLTLKHSLIMTMRRLFLAASAIPILGGCAVPFVGGGGDKKSECDRMAAEAIQTKDVTRVRELAAGASDRELDVDRRRGLRLRLTRAPNQVVYSVCHLYPAAPRQARRVPAAPC